MTVLFGARFWRSIRVAGVVFGFAMYAGVSAADGAVSPRIVGGVPAPDDAWPSVVQVYTVIDSTTGTLCGGTVIDKRWVLTAGHCVADAADRALPPSSFVILADTQVLGGEDGTAVGVTNVYLHPQFRRANAPVNDIALLELSQEVDTEAMPLVSASPAVGAMAAIVGWGTTSSASSEPSAVLREAEVPVVSNDACAAVPAYSGLIQDTMLCAGYADGGVDACLGDSGGPLMVLNDGVYEQAGITSFGYDCALTYGVYTRVSSYLTWIDQYVSVDTGEGDGGDDGGGGAIDPWWAVLLTMAVIPAVVRRRRAPNA